MAIRVSQWGPLSRSSKNKSLSQLVKQPEDSQFWVGLMHVIEDLFPREREIQT